MEGVAGSAKGCAQLQRGEGSRLPGPCAAAGQQPSSPQTMDTYRGVRAQLSSTPGVCCPSRGALGAALPREGEWIWVGQRGVNVARDRTLSALRSGRCSRKSLGKAAPLARDSASPFSFKYLHFFISAAYRHRTGIVDYNRVRLLLTHYRITFCFQMQLGGNLLHHVMDYFIMLKLKQNIFP